MKESFEAGVSRGESLAQSAREEFHALPLTDPRVQVFLAKIAFPADSAVMNKWIEEDALGVSLSSRFRAYLEDPIRTPEEREVDIQNAEDMQTLLARVREHAPEPTVH